MELCNLSWQLNDVPMCMLLLSEHVVATMQQRPESTFAKAYPHKGSRNVNHKRGVAMNRQIASLAIALGASLGGAAHAQSSMQLYGTIDLGMEHFENGAGSVSKLGNGILNPSVIGLKGSFGTFQMGRFYSFNYIAATQIDPFGTGMTGTIKNIDPASNNYTRVSQGLAYVTPNFAGFTAGLAYAFGAQPSSTSNGQAYELNLNYKNGPLMVGADYLRHNYTATASTTVPGTFDPFNPYTKLAKEFGPAATVPADGYFTNKISEIYGSYDLGVAKLSAMYSQQKYGEGLSYTGANKSPDLRVWMIGATVPVGPGSLLASYAQRKDNNSVGDTKVKQYAIGYTYPLSKRTNVYTSYAHISNGAAVDQYVGDNGINAAGTLGGQSSSGFALGIRHSF